MSLVKVINKVKPTEIYKLAAQSHVQESFDAPEFIADVDAMDVLRVLEAVRANYPETLYHFYQASSSKRINYCKPYWIIYSFLLLSLFLV